MKSPSVNLGTKAETLKQLRKLVKKSAILDLLNFTVGEWEKDERRIVVQTQKHFGQERLIVRSSAITEDTFSMSNAGRFRSIPNVSLNEPHAFVEAVNSVITSYGDERQDHQIFVQKFLNNVEMSGVVFTRDLETGAPYMTLNIDFDSGRTDAITSGKGLGHSTFVIYKNHPLTIQDPRIKKLITSVQEIEKLVGYDALDIEFCCKAGRIYILQVRPLTSRRLPHQSDEAKIKTALAQVHQKISELNQPHPYLYGKQTAYGIMPDWNPAEMIGVKPRPLALSLYKELITDNIWAYQRDNYGYKNLRSFPLMISFAGHPYIDVRVDFNSFIPKDLDEELSHKLAQFYLDKLKRIPTSHDKVEFDIVYSCYTFDLSARLKELLRHGFSRNEIQKIKKELLNLTNNIIRPDGLAKDDYKKVEELEQRRKKIMDSKLPEVNKIYWLAEDCKRYGTLPFAGLARAAFIAAQFLNSMVELQIITTQEKSSFMKSLNTVTKQLSRDTRLLAQGRLTLKKFLEQYGHLRPGTYDILSESYDENPKKYFTLKREKHLPEGKISNFRFSEKQKKTIAQLLKKHHLETDPENFLDFLKRSIEGREYAKFVFTKSLNDILHLIKNYGKARRFNADDLSFLDVGTILKLYSAIAFADEKKLFKEEIERNREIYHIYRSIKLPHLITHPDDIYGFSPSAIEPNFITHGKTTASTILLNGNGARPSALNGKLVCIESADPGFDWIFSHNIAGLITMYGGVNSHMSIRASELNIPAVIGCGSVNFEAWSSAKRLEVDCLNRQVIILA